MKRLFAFVICCVVVLGAHASTLSEPILFHDVCDASAAVIVSADLFAAASDEDNILRFYRLSQPGKPVHATNLNTLLFGKKKSPEMDIEGAASLGQRFFWITSHGRNAKGEIAPNRCRLFALEIHNRGANISIQHVGKIYTNLIADLSREPKLARFRLLEAAKLAPKSRGALNIEALTATPEGALLIGFRNPVPESRALIVPLLNPNELMDGKPPRFGEPILLDLGGLGLRGMDSARDGYYLLAGSADGEGQSCLFFWNGEKSAPQPVNEINFSGINPEGICLINAKSDLLITSDDGARSLNGEDCKELPESQRRFRAVRVFR